MTVRIAICDYGVGNVRSVERAVTAAGAEAVLTGDGAELLAADGVILPGVGAFAPAAQTLRDRGIDGALHRVVSSGTPLLGVCLGYQLLFAHSDEGEGADGLGFFPGRVRRIDSRRGTVPHMGWNRLQIRRSVPLLDGLDSGAPVYFVHSFSADIDDDVIAVTDHGGPLAAASQRRNVMGTQFHPEKSGPVGLRIYANFVTACAAVAERRVAPAPWP